MPKTTTGAKAPTVKAPGFKPSLKDVTVSITGTMVNTRGSIIPINDSTETRETKLKMLDDAGHKVDQYYLCHEGTCTYPHGQQGFRTGDLKLRGREESGKMIVVPPEQLEELNASGLETGVLELDVYPAEQVDAQTWPGAKGYWFQPDRADSFYGFLVEKARNPKVALIGLMRARGSDKLYRVVPFLDGFALQETLRPQDVREFPAIPVTVGEKEQAMGDKLLDALIDDFDPEDYASDRVQRLREILAAAEDGVVLAPSSKPAKAQPADDLSSVLEAALAAADATKASKKKSKADKADKAE